MAESDSTVLLLGESGTGKERIADVIHQHSLRSSGPIVKVNCGAFVENLLMSELFGHEKGAFTGALNSKRGRFELANGGTLFLDEIGDVSAKTQVTLLRVLQEGTYERVGGSRTLHADVRIVCATNRNLEQLVKTGKFRLDLYYRLKGIVLELPPLRERLEDIPRLVQHFLSDLKDTSGKRFSRSALRRLLCYSWPGNIRELQNFVRAVALFVQESVIDYEHLRQFEDFFSDGETREPSEDIEAIIDRGSSSALSALSLPLEETSSAVTEVGGDESTDVAPPSREDSLGKDLFQQAIDDDLGLAEAKKNLELEFIRRALTRTSGNVTRAATLLKMKRPRLSQIINANNDLKEFKDQLAS